MNDVLKEFAEQATTYYNSGLGTEIEIFDKEKFAELIVMKCLTICEELGDKGMDGHYCADQINKTFRS
jgi:hypothetical protein